MRIAGGSAGTMTPSHGPLVVGPRAGHCPAVACGLEQVTNTAQQLVQPVGFGAPAQFAATMASGLLFTQPIPGTDSIASAGGGVSDSRSLEPVPKRMRMASDALGPAAFHEVAAIRPLPTQPCLTQWNAVADTQLDMRATLIDPEALVYVHTPAAPAGRVSDLPAASGGIEQRSQCTSVVEFSMNTQLPEAVDALQAWALMSSTERAEAGSLYQFLKSRNAILRHPRLGKPLTEPVIADLEWAMLEEHTSQRFAAFLHDREIRSAGRCAFANGMLSEIGAEAFVPILVQAGLPLPPVAEPDSVWQPRAQAGVELWCQQPLADRRALSEFVERLSPRRPSTPKQTLRLHAIEYSVMHQNLHLLDEEQQELYGTIPDFADARGVAPAALGHYVTLEGIFEPGRYPLSRLLPAHLQAQPAMPEPRWMRQARPLVEQWCRLSLERPWLSRFAARSSPGSCWIVKEKVRLTAFEYYVRYKRPDLLSGSPDLMNESQEQCPTFEVFEAFARERGVPPASLHRYVQPSAKLTQEGEILKRLLPSRLAPDQPRAAALSPRAEPSAMSAASAASLSATDEIATVGDNAIGIVPQPSADVSDELNFDWDSPEWDDLGSRIAGYWGQL